ncbi:MAG: hypothetical protein ACT4O2_13690 [Beijerinckiaceae bacterium]
MARAGRGGNTSLRGGVARGESAISLFLAAVFLGPLVIFKLAQEDRRKRTGASDASITPGKSSPR